MKIDCPHCGVHGSVDDSLAGKRLRCPKCSKVFLVAEEVLLDMAGHNLVRQENFHDSVADEQVPVSEEAEPENLDEPETAEEELEDTAEAESDEESQEESLDLKEYMEEAGREEESVPDDDAEEAAEEVAEEDDILAFVDEDDDDVSEEAVLDSCDECGESLQAEFLETVDGKKYCALCLPEDQEEDLELTDTDQQGDVEKDAEEEIEREEDAETVDSFDSAMALMVDDSGNEEESLKEPCSVCGETFHPDFMQEIDSKLYCGVCQPEVVETVSMVSSDEERENDAEEVQINDIDFTVGELIKDAWQKTKGAKGSIWGGVGIMYLILFGLSLGGPLALMQVYGESNPMMAMGINGGLQIVTALLSMLFSGGLMLIGVHQVLGQRVSWTMVFAGFSGSKILSMSIAVFLQVILIIVGFVLLVLPGIYLSVGYALTLPLILDKGLGPWEALEASRKAIHKKWWTVFGLYFVMMLLYAVSAIPLGLGLIWTVPMFFVMVGVLYSRFFVSEADLEADEEGEEVE
jgi:predicted Zn finger-like uncharacterized protein